MLHSDPCSRYCQCKVKSQPGASCVIASTDVSRKMTVTWIPFKMINPADVFFKSSTTLGTLFLDRIFKICVCARPSVDEINLKMRSLAFRLRCRTDERRPYFIWWLFNVTWDENSEVISSSFSHSWFSFQLRKTCTFPSLFIRRYERRRLPHFLFRIRATVFPIGVFRVAHCGPLKRAERGLN